MLFWYFTGGFGCGCVSLWCFVFGGFWLMLVWAVRVVVLLFAGFRIGVVY